MYILRGFILSVFLATCAHAESITVAAAISLKEVMTDVAKEYKASGADDVELTFGSSGQLLSQIKNVAPIDLFISAARQQVTELKKAGLADEASERVVAGNRLVLIVPADVKDAPKSFEDLADARVKRVAVGEPKTVPAGQYAMQVLEAMRLTGALDGRIVHGSNVRQVLDYVIRGEVDAGIVYATDAASAGEKVKLVATADAKTHEPIEYPAIIVKASKKHDAAQKFLDFLTSEKAAQIFAGAGFTPAGAASSPTTAPAP